MTKSRRVSLCGVLSCKVMDRGEAPVCFQSCASSLLTCFLQIYGWNQGTLECAQSVCHFLQICTLNDRYASQMHTCKYMHITHRHTMHTYTCTHAHTHSTHMHTHIAHTCTHIHMHTYEHIHTRMRTHKHTHMRTHMHTHAHTYTCTHMHTSIHKCPYTCTSMCTHIHTHWCLPVTWHVKCAHIS